MKQVCDAALPPLLAALESDDGEMVVLSFALTASDASRRLTPAECEVVALLLAGRSNAEIATSRGTAFRTVANQIASVFRKLGVGSRLELVANCRSWLWNGSERR